MRVLARTASGDEHEGGRAFASIDSDFAHARAHAHIMHASVATCGRVVLFFFMEIVFSQQGKRVLKARRPSGQYK